MSEQMKTPQDYIAEAFAKAFPGAVMSEDETQNRLALARLRKKRKEAAKAAAVKESEDNKSEQKGDPKVSLQTLHMDNPKWLPEGKTCVLQFDVHGFRTGLVGHLTVVYMPEKKKTKSSPGSYEKGFYFGAAFCSPTDEDKYRPETGEGIAKNKAMRRGIIPLNLQKIFDSRSPLEAFMDFLLEKPLPTWVINAISGSEDMGGFGLVPRGSGTLRRFGFSEADSERQIRFMLMKNNFRDSLILPVLTKN